MLEMQYAVSCTACVYFTGYRVSIVVVIMGKGGPACGCDPCDAGRRVHAAVMEARRVPQEAVRHLFSQEVLRQVMDDESGIFAIWTDHRSPLGDMLECFGGSVNNKSSSCSLVGAKL